MGQEIFRVSNQARRKESRLICDIRLAVRKLFSPLANPPFHPTPILIHPAYRILSNPPPPIALHHGHRQTPRRPHHRQAQDRAPSRSPTEPRARRSRSLCGPSFPPSSTDTKASLMSSRIAPNASIDGGDVGTRCVPGCRRCPTEWGRHAGQCGCGFWSGLHRSIIQD